MKFRKGDWVAQIGIAQPHFGKVVGVFKDADGVYLNICMYDPTGDRVGRWSDPLGGPSNFEPACPASAYAKIEEPKLPLERVGLYGNWDVCLKFC